MGEEGTKVAAARKKGVQKHSGTQKAPSNAVLGLLLFKTLSRFFKRKNNEFEVKIFLNLFCLPFLISTILETYFVRFLFY